MKREIKNKGDWKWPVGIFVGYLIFVIATVGFVFFTFTVKADLVAEKYYEKTLAYQEQIDSEQNALDLAVPLVINLKKDLLTIGFPPSQVPGGIEGTINLYRPSDASLDFSIEIMADEAGVQTIDTDNLSRGLWKVQVRWMSTGIEFFTESSIFLR